MPNCALYTIPNNGSRNGFLENGDYIFSCGYEVQKHDGSQNAGGFDSDPIPWSSSDQTMDNSIKDSAIAWIQGEIGMTLTRNDIRIFR